MRADVLFCVDRIEGDRVVLMADDGAVVTVLIGDLPDAQAGNLYRCIKGRYERDVEAETGRKERVRWLQDRLRSTSQQK